MSCFADVSDFADPILDVTEGHPPVLSIPQLPSPFTSSVGLSLHNHTSRTNIGSISAHAVPDVEHYCNAVRRRENGGPPDGPLSA